MPQDFGTVLSIVGFYFTLIGLLGSLFFIHLGNWYKDITTTEQKWKRYRNLDAREKHIECYLEAFDEKNPLAYVGFLLLTGFMVTLGIFGEVLKSYLPSGTSLSLFLYLPVYVFFALYLVSSLLYLILGYRKINKLFAQIDKKLS